MIDIFDATKRLLEKMGDLTESEVKLCEDALDILGPFYTITMQRNSEPKVMYLALSFTRSLLVDIANTGVRLAGGKEYWTDEKLARLNVLSERFRKMMLDVALEAFGVKGKK